MDSNAKTQPSQQEEQLFVSLRAAAWDEFSGQTATKKALQLAIDAATKRNESLDHVLLYGPPGLGKTTLAHLIAKALGSQLKITSGTALTKAGDLAAILTNLKPKDVLFIDEIHRLPKAVEETLYPAMEDYALDIIVGQGPSARTIRLDLPNFTLVGATTRFGLLAGPFRDRFGLTHRLKMYSADVLKNIVQQASEKLSYKIDNTAAQLIAERSRGTPRIALKLLQRVRDMALVSGDAEITTQHAHTSFALLGIDELGLQELDRTVLEAIIFKHDGGPVGLSTLAATLHEDALTIEEVYEPYLLQAGLLKRTPKGRVASQKARNHLSATEHYQKK